MDLKSEKTLKKLSIIIMILYAIVTIWVIVFKCNLIKSIESCYIYLKDLSISERLKVFNKPFKNYFTETIDAPKYVFELDDFLNILIFIPIGMYISYFLKRYKFISVILFSTIICTIFEVIQLFTLIGSFAIQDFITNITGGILGYICYKLIFINDTSVNKIKVLNIISIGVIIVLIPIVIYSIFNTVNTFDYYLDIINKKI